MIPAVNFSTLPCLVSSGVTKVSLGGVNGVFPWLSCGGNTVLEDGSVAALGWD